MSENYYKDWLENSEYVEGMYHGDTVLLWRKDGNPVNEEGEIKYYALSMEEVFNLGAKYGISVEKRRTFDDGK